MVGVLAVDRGGAAVRRRSPTAAGATAPASASSGSRPAPRSASSPAGSPFALGIAIALAAVFASQRGMAARWRSPSAILCPLASPVAAPLPGLRRRRPRGRRAQPRRASSWPARRSAPRCCSPCAFPEGGTEPFVFSSFQPAILIAIAVFLAIPKEERLLRYGVAAYAVALAGAFLIDSPMGGNATRMGALFLGPGARLRPLAPPEGALLVRARARSSSTGSGRPVVRDLETVYAQPSVERRLLHAGPRLPPRRHGRPSERYRVEVRPGRAPLGGRARAPKGIYIARGWERQLDRKLNALFYEDENGPLTAEAYRALARRPRGRLRRGARTPSSTTPARPRRG